MVLGMWRTVTSWGKIRLTITSPLALFCLNLYYVSVLQLWSTLLYGRIYVNAANTLPVSLACNWHRTHLTGVAPGPSNGGTAQGLRTHNACKLPLAHLVVDLSETRTGPVIWNVKEGRETGFIATHQSQNQHLQIHKTRDFLLIKMLNDKRPENSIVKTQNLSIMRSALQDFNVFCPRHCK